MRLALCIAVKNRSCVIVEKEDSLSFLNHVAEKVEDCPQFTITPWMTKDKKIVLPLMPRMLQSLKIHKKPEDDWVVVVVDYGSTDVDIYQMLQEELGEKIPWHLEIVKDYPYFDRGGGLAKAAEIAERKFHADSVFFCDSDILFGTRNVLDKAIDVTSKGLFYYPVFFSFALDNHSKGVWRDTSYGNFACRIEDYKKTEGWYHNISWGWEDRALADSIPESKKVRELVPGFFHQWHPLQWEFRVKEYPVKEYIFKDAAIKELPFTYTMKREDAVRYYVDHEKEFYGEDGHETLVTVLKRYMKPLSTSAKIFALDVGACVGDYTMNLVELCPESNTSYLSFEPNPANLPKLEKLVTMIPSMKLYKCCISEKEGTASFYNWKGLDANQEGNLVGGLQSGGEKICEVDVKRLDTLLDSEVKNEDCIIKFLKIDTEGTDTRVIKSLGRYIRKTNYIIFECSDCLDDHRGPGIPNPMKDIVDYLSYNGFDTFRIGTKKLLKVNDDYWDDTYEKKKFWSNCFAMRKDDPLLREMIDSNFSYKGI